MSHDRSLRLKAADVEDLALVSALLQDALLDPTAFDFAPARSRFAGPLVRFLHEERQRPAVGPLRQRPCLLAFERVRAVRFRALAPEGGPRPLELLAVKAANGGRVIDLVFAGGGVIRVEVEAIDCRLEDVGTPWLTTLKPRHGDGA